MEWGLGHASRCIPILNYLLNTCQADLVVAANGPQASLIRNSFPLIKIVNPPAYVIQYHKNRAGTITKLAFSLPHLAQQIRAENRWLREFAENHPLDAIISDNRYGCWHPQVPSYLITHQLAIKTPFGKAVDALVRNQLYRYIEKFNRCWIPDYKEQELSLAGELSHPKRLPGIPVDYIGPLTRISQTIKNQPIPGLSVLPESLFVSPVSNSAFQFDAHELKQNQGTAIQVLVILSGPEPQRSIFEELILQQWAEAPGKALLLVRGLPETAGPDPTQAAPPANVKFIPNAMVVNHLSAEQLSQAIANTECILTRSGYSSIMDLLPQQSNCWMVPTPGQTEQEYLARYLAQKGLIQTQSQDSFSLLPILHPTGTRRVPDG